MGCPLRGTDYGSMVIALKSMAAATTGVPIDDGTMGRMLGGDEDAHLTYLGRDVFEALWREYNFRVKIYRETTTESPSLPWAELGLVCAPCHLAYLQTALRSRSHTHVGSAS